MVLAEWDPRRGRQGRTWRRLLEELCPPGSLCQIPECTKASRLIVHGLRPNHPLGPSLDHIIPLEDGGHPTARENLRPAHFGCNAARENRLRRLRRLARPRARPSRVRLASERLRRSTS